MRATPEHCRICGRHHRRCGQTSTVNEHGALLLALAEIDTYARHVHEELSTTPWLRSDDERLSAVADLLAVAQCVIADAVSDEQSPLWLISLSDLLAFHVAGLKQALNLAKEPT